MNAREAGARLKRLRMQLRPESCEFLLAYTAAPVRRVEVPDSVWGGQDSFLIRHNGARWAVSEDGHAIAAMLRAGD